MMEITLETIYQQQLADKVELKAEMQADKAERQADKAELKADIAGVRSEMQADKAELKADINSVKSWCIGLMLSTILVVAAITTTVLTSMLLAR